MELGNMCFGNSRGPIEFPDRDIINSKEWEELMDLLDLDFYCIPNGELSSKLVKTDKGTYAFVKDDKIIFEIFPYYWGDCTCGAEDYNTKMDERIRNEIFTKEEYEIYSAWEEWCDDDCPASEVNIDNEESLLAICTCGAMERNVALKKKKEAIKDKIEEYENRTTEEAIYHTNDCLLLKHNFIYHEGMDDEFWIDWYKYPFRDSYMNKELSKNEVIEIFKKCIELVKESS